MTARAEGCRCQPGTRVIVLVPVRIRVRTYHAQPRSQEVVLLIQLGKRNLSQTVLGLQRDNGGQPDHKSCRGERR
jgi:hypothetical protein